MRHDAIPPFEFENRAVIALGGILRKMIFCILRLHQRRAARNRSVFREEHRIIIPLTVGAILDDEIARKLA